MYTLEELKDIKAKHNKMDSELSNSVNDMKSNIKVIDEKMNVALQGNNVEEYKRLFVKKSGLETEIKAYEEYLSKSKDNPFKVSDIVESWGGRVDKYNKDFDKLFTKFNKAKEEFVSIMSELDLLDEQMRSERLEYINFSKTDSGFKDYKTLEKDEYYKTYLDEKNKAYLLRTQRIVIR